jgi:DNA-binding CsgD family transcriptional regulator
MEIFSLPMDTPMYGLGNGPARDDRIQLQFGGGPSEAASSIETLVHADELAARAVESIGRGDATRAGGNFERSLSFYVSATTQLAALAIIAHQDGDEVRAAALTSQSVLLLRQLPGRVRLAVGMLRATVAGTDGPDPAVPLRFIAEAALRRQEARAVLGETVRAHLAATLRAVFTDPSPRCEVTATRAIPSTKHPDPYAQHSSSTPPPIPPSVLSSREREVVRLIADGLTNREIGCRLGVKGITVNTFVSRIFSKLGVDNRAAAAVYAVRNGLCETR